MPALTLTFDECNKIMTIVKKGLLNSSRISTSLPSSTLYGPKAEGGLELNHLYLTQGLMHIEKFYRFLNTNTITGKLIRVSLETAILEVGIGRNLFTLNYKSFHMLLSDCWIKGIWKFAQANSIEIIDRNTFYPLPQREGDVFIMEALENQGYSKQQLQILNRCRLYLQIMTLSDIMNGFGTGFTSMFKCRKNHQKYNNYKWPFQPEPTTSMRKLWRKALRKTFGLRAGNTSHQLGSW